MSSINKVFLRGTAKISNNREEVIIVTEYHDEDNMDPQQAAPEKKKKGSDDVWKFLAIAAVIAAIVFGLLRQSPQPEVPVLKEAQETVKSVEPNGPGYGDLNGVSGR